jgi:hypothetical protein
MNRNRLVSGVCSYAFAGATATVMLACGADPGPVDQTADEPVSGRQEPSTAYWFTLWPRVNNAYNVPICFRQVFVSTPTPDWAGDKSRVQNALITTWQANSAIVFQFQGDCPPYAVPSDWIPIELRYDAFNSNPWSGLSDNGMGARLGSSDCYDCETRVIYADNSDRIRALSVHEVGHALGLRHECSRTDYPAQGCWDLNNQVWEPPSQDQCLDVPKNGAEITLNWDPESIMAQWECYINRTNNSVSYWELSQGDRVGIGILYPHALTRYAGSIGSWHGFHTSGGLLVRTGGTVISDWTEAGGGNIMNAMDWYRWAGYWQLWGLGSEASPLAGTYSYRFTYMDYWGRSNECVDTVIADSSKHTALLMATLDSI